MYRTKAKETKTGINAQDARAKRVGQSVQLRREDREHALASRRRHNSDAPEDSNNPHIQDDQILLDLPNIPTFVQQLDSNDEEVVLNATTRLRRLVSLVNEPPFAEVANQGGPAKLVKLLSWTTRPDICFEAAWCLTNIASGDAKHTQVVVNAGAIDPLIQLLEHNNDNVRDQAVWALGNIAGESPVYRDQILAHGAMQKVLNIAHRVLRLCMLRNVAWTLSNFCRGRNPQPDFSIVSQALPTLHNMLNFRDDDVIAEAAWSLSFLSDDTGATNLPENHKIEAVIHSGCLPRLIALLSHPNPNIKTPALRTIGNIVTGTNFQTQMVLNNNVLPPLISLLTNNRRGIRREAAWALSNVAAGAKPQVMALVEANAFHALHIAVSQADAPIKREIVWVVCNAVSNRDGHILSHLANIGWIPALLSFLRDDDVDLQLCALDALHHFLAFGEANKLVKNGEASLSEVNPYAAIVHQAGGVELLDQLERCLDKDIYHKSLTLLTEYFGFTPQDDDDEQGQQFDGAQGTLTFDADQQEQSYEF